MPEWDALFRPTAPLAETVLRGTVMFLALFAMLRIVGKREAGAHSLTDLLVVVLVAEAAASGLSGGAGGITDSVLLVATILFWSVALDGLAYRWAPLARLLTSRPSPLIVDGRINPRALRREFMRHDELAAELRLHGIADPREVARAYLEPNGMISVIRSDKAAVDDAPRPPTMA